MGATTATPGRFGAALQTPTPATLASLSARDLTPGTLIWVASLARLFKLTLSTESLVADEVVAVANISNMRWKVDAIPGASMAPATALAPGSMPAADFAKLSSVPAGAGLVFPWESGAVTFTTLGATAVVAPARAGSYIVSISIQAIFLVKTGTVSTSPIFKIGTNAAHDDFVASATMTAAANLDAVAAPFVGIISPVSPTGGLRKLVEATSDLVAEISTAAAGASLVMTGVLSSTVYYRAI